MHDHLKEQVELMGYQPENVMEDAEVEQDFLIMSRLMKITRTADFSNEELEQYKLAAASAVEDVRYVMGSRILTPDFTPEELHDYQWSAEHPTGSSRGYRLTEEPLEQEVKEWQETMEWLNKLDFDKVRKNVKFIDKDETNPYADDPYGEGSRWSDVNIQPISAYEHCRSKQVGPDDTHKVVAQCPLGTDPYRLLDEQWPWF